MTRPKKLYQFDSEVKISIEKHSKHALIEDLKLNVCKENGSTHFRKEQLFALSVNFYAPYATYLLFRLQSSKNNQGIFDSITLQSADLYYDADSFWSIW